MSGSRSVGDTGLPLEDPGALELDVLGTEVVEETAPLAEEHRGEMSRTYASTTILLLDLPLRASYEGPYSSAALVKARPGFQAAGGNACARSAAAAKPTMALRPTHEV